MTSKVGFAVVSLVVAGCAGAPKPPPPAPAPACRSVVVGSVHDLDNGDAPVPGAAVTGGPDNGVGAVLTDETGGFVLEGVAPSAGITVYVADTTAGGALPACVNQALWLGVHTRGPGALVVRTDRRPVDIAAIERASAQREVVAEKWLAFYERFGAVVESTRGDCARMGEALEQFVTQNRSDIDAMTQQQTAMPSRDRALMKDTIDRKFSARRAALEPRAKDVDACHEEPRVRRAVASVPR